MRTAASIAGLILLGLILVLAQPPGDLAAGAAQQSATGAADSSPDKPLQVLDPSAMDKSADPCVDFYQYACGSWIAHNPIPADQGVWGRFNELQEHNREVLHQILERASAPSPGRDPVTQKIGDFYASCMDEGKANAGGAKPLAAELAGIAKISGRQDLVREVAHLQSIGVGSTLFRFGSSPDYHDASMEIAALGQGGLGLPDRDYYLKDDAKSAETRQKYLEHMTRVFELLGDAAPEASREAETVLKIETELAKPAMDRVSLRNPANRDHPMTPQQAAELAPGFDFPRYFTAAGAPAFSKVNVSNPQFFKTVNGLLDSIPLADWKTYLRWHLVREFAPYLSDAFVQESFRFRQQYLGGQKELQARWKRCVRLTDEELGEALGQPYVQETFGAEGKQRTLVMVQAIENAMGDDLRNLPWMTAETRQQALAKLAEVTNKIGYPDKWRDYSKVAVERGDFLGNVERAENFEWARDLNKIGKPVDRQEWGMTPPTVNAYYNSLENNINFPAGILQPPFFDKNGDEAENLGGIGAVIGHELTHGFDDQGAKFDGKGNLRNWWTDQDRREFEQRTGCVADEYSQFVAVDDLHINGRLTLGENTADNGGLRLSFMALEDRLNGKDQPLVDGFTPQQRFFLAYGQIWCQNASPEYLRLRTLTDPHSPGRWRVNGVVSNMPEFQQAFHCRPGQAMVRQNACRVW